MFGQIVLVRNRCPMRDRRMAGAAGGRTLSGSGDKTMFGVVVSRMAKMSKPNFADGVARRLPDGSSERARMSVSCQQATSSPKPSKFVRHKAARGFVCEQPAKAAHDGVISCACNAGSGSTDQALGTAIVGHRWHDYKLEGPVDLTLVFNRSNAFGLFPDYGESSRWAPTALSFAIAAILLGLMLRRSTSIMNAFGFAFISAGALGNALDRLRLGAVVDLFDASKLRFVWVFNVADVSIDSGIALVLLAAFRLIAEYEQALALDRNLAIAHGWIGLAKYFMGRGAETEAHIQEALRLSPRDAFVFRWMTFVGLVKAQVGAEDEAVAWLRRGIEANRNQPMLHFNLAAALARLGALDEARAAVQAGLALNPGFTINRFRSGTPSDNPTFLAQRERIYQGMRTAGVPEG
jgi:lipoprotein signal peptidase